MIFGFSDSSSSLSLSVSCRGSLTPNLVAVAAARRSSVPLLVGPGVVSGQLPAVDASIESKCVEVPVGTAPPNVSGKVGERSPGVVSGQLPAVDASIESKCVEVPVGCGGTGRNATSDIPDSGASWPLFLVRFLLACFSVVGGVLRSCTVCAVVKKVAPFFTSLAGCALGFLGCGVRCGTPATGNPPPGSVVLTPHKLVARSSAPRCQQWAPLLLTLGLCMAFVWAMHRAPVCLWFSAARRPLMARALVKAGRWRGVPLSWPMRSLRFGVPSRRRRAAAGRQEGPQLWLWCVGRASSVRGHAGAMVVLQAHGRPVVPVTHVAAVRRSDLSPLGIFGSAPLFVETARRRNWSARRRNWSAHVRPRRRNWSARRRNALSPWRSRRSTAARSNCHPFSATLSTLFLSPLFLSPFSCHPFPAPLSCHPIVH